MKSALDSIVSVYDSNVNIGKCCYKLLGSKLLKYDVLGILNDITDGCCDACILFKSKKSFLCKEKECSCLVGNIVGNSYGCSGCGCGA